VRGSGCGRVKGDLISETIHVEAKSSRLSGTILPAKWFVKARRQANHRLPIVQFAFSQRHVAGDLNCLRWWFIRWDERFATAIKSAFGGFSPEKTVRVNHLTQYASDARAWNTIERDAVRGEFEHVVLRDGSLWIVVPEHVVTKERIALLSKGDQ